MIGSILLNGLLILKGFSWYIYPIYGNIGFLTYGQACGLSILFSMIFARYRINIDENKDFTELTSRAIISWIHGFILLFVGWLGQLIIY